MYANKIKDIDELQKRINTYRPLTPELQNNLKNYFKIGLTYSSNALEGNSLTETETKIILEDGLTVSGKPLKEHFEAIGHANAYDFLFTIAHNNNKTISEKDIIHLHKLFYYHIDSESAGAYRSQQVFITGTSFIPPSACQVPHLMRQWTNTIEHFRSTMHPIEFAAWLHKELVTIHPFIDGNGRTARLLMNLALLQDGYVITIIPPLLRNDYINLLKKTQVEPKDDQPFINFISTMVYESQKDYIRMIQHA